MLTFKQKLKLSGLATGVFGCFTIFALVQEQIFRERYGNNTDPVDGKSGERFRLPMSAGLMQNAVYAILAKILILATHEAKNESSHYLFALAALFSVLSNFTSRLSLQWVPYTTQIVGKASKPIPVMLLGFLIGGKRYTLLKVVFVLMIVLGVILFNFDIKNVTNSGDNLLIGNLLLGLSLLCDGLCGATEERMRSSARPSALNFMYYLAVWSLLYHTIGIIALGEIPDFIGFVSRHPDIIKYFVAFVCVGALGQIFICSILSAFGALPLSITTTTRKFFSVILSVIIYQNVLLLQQWIATGIIFSTLLIDSLMSKTSSKTNNSKEDPEDVKETDPPQTITSVTRL